MNPNINLAHLKFFCDTITYGSLSEAAKMNFISQSAISQAIAKLEVIFGTTLINATRQKITPTPEGEIVFENAKNIFKNVQGLFDSIQKTRGEVVGNVSFATTKSLAMSLVSVFYKKIKQAFPLLKFQFEPGEMNFIRRSLKQEEVDFAIVVDGDIFQGYEKYSLKKGNLNLYQVKGSSPDLIKQGILIDHDNGLYVPQILDFLTKKKITPAVYDAIPSWDVLSYYTHLGYAVGFFPDYILLNNRFPNLEIHPLKTPPYEYEICAIYNKGTSLSKTAKTFLDSCKSILEEAN